MRRVVCRLRLLRRRVWFLPRADGGEKPFFVDQHFSADLHERAGSSESVPVVVPGVKAIRAQCRLGEKRWMPRRELLYREKPARRLLFMLLHRETS
jgi:hypothetical protein